VNEFTSRDFEIILQALRHLQQKVHDTQYPTYQLRIERLDEMDDVIAKVRAVRG
jgi:hypothetical protein